MAPFRLIVGLGNPGGEYAETRHNVGFMVLDLLAARAGAKFKVEKKWQAAVATTAEGWLCKPQTYMNLSGECVSAIGHFYKIEPSQVLVVLDDLALPLGRLRFREQGSAGGQKGLQSVLNHLGTPSVPRLRVGIGSATGGAVSHVLGRFTAEEKPIASEAVARAADAIEFAQSHGFPAAMNRYNQNPTT